MTPLLNEFTTWLADYHLLASILLVVAIGALSVVKQPVNRRAITHSTLIGLLLLAALCAVPGWSLLNLTSTPATVIIDDPVMTSTGDFDRANAMTLPLQRPAEIAAPPILEQPSDVPSPISSPARKVPWLLIAVYAWNCGVICSLAWLAIGWWSASRLRGNSQPAPATVTAMLRDLEQAAGCRGAEVLLSSRINVAVALGILRPAVLLPEDWLRTQSRDDLRTVLAHEAAHLRNHDLQWLALSRSLHILLWAQPLFWFVRRRMRLDQEALADAAAAELTSRQYYAEQLVAWARDVAARPAVRLSSAVGLWECPSQIRRRVAILIDEHFTVFRECSVQWRSASLFAFALFALGLSLVTVHPAKSEPQQQPPEQPPEHKDATTGNDDSDLAMIGDRFILCPVTTDLQRSLLGDVVRPQSDASLCVFVNYAAFEGEQIEARSPALATLSERLATLAKTDNRGVLFRVLVSNDLPVGSVGERAHSLARLCEPIGRRAGYKHSKWSTTWGVDPWKEFVARAEAAAKLGDSDAEQSVGNSQVRVFPVRTFLSRLLVNADCVVNIAPIIRQQEGTRLPEDFLPAMTQFVPQLEYDRKQTMLIRVRFAESAEKRLEEWVNDRSARPTVAKQFGFEDCNVEQAFTNEEDTPTTTEEGELSEVNVALGDGEAEDDSKQEEEGSQLLRDLRAKAAPLLTAMAEEHGYGLEPGKDLVRVAPPFAPIRMDYYRTGHPSQADAIRRGPEAMVFRWVDERLANWGMSFGDPGNPGYSITSVLDALADIHSQNIEGPEDLLRKNLPGDWVVRPRVDKARIVAQMQQILQNELSLQVSLEFREVKRRVYVARGKYQLTPLPGQRGQDKQTLADESFTTDEIQVFGKQLVPNSGAGGGTGSFVEFLNWLGRWVGTPVVSHADKLPANKLSWHLHERSPSTEQTRDEDHDPKLVLPNITAQTGLEFALEVRPIEVLFVEHVRTDDGTQRPQQ